MRVGKITCQSIDDIELLRQIDEDVGFDNFADSFAWLMRTRWDPGRSNDSSNAPLGQNRIREFHLIAGDIVLAHILRDELNELIAGHRVDPVLQLLERLPI